mgnify:CR=1 FL=1
MRGWLTTRQAAELLGLDVQVIRYHIRSGRLAAQRHGNSLVLARKDVRAFRLPRRGRPRKR